MPLSFLPSYLRSWIEIEKRFYGQVCDLRETIDEELDWVLVDYQSEASTKHTDYLLQEYIVIEAKENEANAIVDEEWLNVDQNPAINTARSRKATKRARKKAKRTANRQSPYLGIPFKFTKLPTDRIPLKRPRINAVSAIKSDCLHNNYFMPEGIALIRPAEPDTSIVPFLGSNWHAFRRSEMLRVFGDLSKKTSTAIIDCDFAPLNHLQVCTTRDLNCVKNSWRFMEKYNQVVDRCIFTDILIRDQSVRCSNNIVSDQCMCPAVVARDQRMIPAVLNDQLVLPCHEPVENDENGIFEDCVDWASLRFSVKTPMEYLHSKYCTTKKTLEDLLKSLLLLHLLVGKNIQSWKDTTMSNVTQLSSPVQNKPTIHYDTANAHGPDTTRRHPNSVHVTSNQLRRLNRMTTRNSVVNSNRQRGMKNGRFRQNVGHRESWH